MSEDTMNAAQVAEAAKEDAADLRAKLARLVAFCEAEGLNPREAICGLEALAMERDTAEWNEWNANPDQLDDQLTVAEYVELVRDSVFDDSRDFIADHYGEVAAMVERMAPVDKAG